VIEREKRFLNLRNIKTIIKNFCPPILWFLFKNLKNGNLKYKSSYNLDKKIESYIDFNNGYFVELGANDGITYSNTYYFEKYKGWKGVLIEPIPHKYLECRKNRSKETQVFCNACVSYEYKEKFVEIIYSDFMSTSLELETDIGNPVNHALLGKQFLEEDEDIFNFGAIAKPLNNILLKANAPKQIDFLSIDVEGAEIEVLKGINHTEYRFKFICIEIRNLQKITEYLTLNNYILIGQLSPHDYLFKDKELK
jgi:FkbM family methyltransferase